MERKPTRPKTARLKAMDLLARRKHSEFELRMKLSRGDFNEDEINDAIEEAKQNGWIDKPEDLAQEVAAQLNARKRGNQHINEFLASRGLPAVNKNLDEELSKARALIVAKLRKHEPFDQATVAKAYRLLANTGFDEETADMVLTRFKGEVEAEVEAEADAVAGDLVDYSADPAADVRTEENSEGL